MYENDTSHIITVNKDLTIFFSFSFYIFFLYDFIVLYTDMYLQYISQIKQYGFHFFTPDPILSQTIQVILLNTT